MIKKLILVICALSIGLVVTGQEKGSTKLNQYNSKNKREGIWYLKVEALRGEVGYQEFGKYVDGKKFGTWQKMDLEGKMISTEFYENDLLNGPAQYFENGALVATGNWRGLNQKFKFDTIPVIDIKTNIEKNVVVPSEYGAVEHGIWRYYNPTTGNMTQEIEYQVGTVISSKTFALPPITDSTVIKKIDANLPHNKKDYYQPPQGKTSQIK